MRKPVPVRLIVYSPETPAGKEELARRAAGVYADATIRRLQALDCSRQQKQILLEEIIQAAKAQTGDQA